MSDRLPFRPESSDSQGHAFAHMHKDAMSNPETTIKSQAHIAAATSELVKNGLLPPCSFNHDTHVQHREHGEHHNPDGHEHGKHHNHHHHGHHHKDHHGHGPHKPDIKHPQGVHSASDHKQVEDTPSRDACPQTSSQAPKGYDEWRKQLGPNSGSSAPENRGDGHSVETHGGAGSATERPAHPVASNLPSRDGSNGSARDITIPNYPDKTHAGGHTIDGTLPYHPGKTTVKTTTLPARGRFDDVPLPNSHANY